MRMLNSACQMVIHPFRKKIDIHDHIYLYVGIRPSYAHRLSLAVAIQGKIGPQLLAVIHQGKGNKGNNHGCFKCG